MPNTENKCWDWSKRLMTSSFTFPTLHNNTFFTREAIYLQPLRNVKKRANDKGGFTPSVRANVPAFFPNLIKSALTVPLPGLLNLEGNGTLTSTLAANPLLLRVAYKVFTCALHLKFYLPYFS